VIDEEWEKQRSRAILAAFQTGRPVFADTDGDLHYTDGPKEQVPVDVGVARQPVPRALALAVRAERASRLALVLSIIASFMNAVMALLWNSWQIAPAVVLAGCAVIWHRVNRHQRGALDRGATR
jgi:hypothetical protein